VSRKRPDRSQHYIAGGVAPSWRILDAFWPRWCWLCVSVCSSNTPTGASNGPFGPRGKAIILARSADPNVGQVRMGLLHCGVELVDRIDLLHTGGIRRLAACQGGQHLQRLNHIVQPCADFDIFQQRGILTKRFPMRHIGPCLMTGQPTTYWTASHTLSQEVWNDSAVSFLEPTDSPDEGKEIVYPWQGDCEEITTCCKTSRDR
jgi:hypothetical protein